MPDYLLKTETSERLLFRKVIPDDFNDWLPFHQEPKSNQFWSGLPENPLEACEEQFSRIFKRYEERTGGLNALIAKETNKLIGLAGLLVQDINGKKELEIGYSILPTHWRQGYAFEAAQRCKQVAFKNNWAKSLISIIQTANVPSQKTALKNGMTIDYTTTFRGNTVYIYRIKA